MSEWEIIVGMSLERTRILFPISFNSYRSNFCPLLIFNGAVHIWGPACGVSIECLKWQSMGRAVRMEVNEFEINVLYCSAHSF